MENHTFIIPAYRESIYLETCIQSLLNQSVKSKIVITTSTPNIFIEDTAEKYGIPCFINHNKEKSIASDWNFALSKATTRYATIAHQDDIYETNYTAIVLGKLNEHIDKDVLIVFADYKDIVNGKTRALSLNSVIKHSLLFPFVFSEVIRNRFFKKLVLQFGDPICCPSVTYNLHQIRSFVFSVDYSCALDWLAWYQMAKLKGSFLYINKKLIQHRIHTDSETTVQLNNGKRRQEELQLFEMMWGKRMAKLIAKIYIAGHKGNKL